MQADGKLAACFSTDLLDDRIQALYGSDRRNGVINVQVPLFSRSGRLRRSAPKRQRASCRRHPQHDPAFEVRHSSLPLTFSFLISITILHPARIIKRPIRFIAYVIIFLIVMKSIDPATRGALNNLPECPEELCSAL